MLDTPLHAVSRPQGNNRALLSGEVSPDGFALQFEDVPVLVSAFRRMVRERAYDVCELALTTYLTAREHGVPITALPIFLVRGLHHGAIQVRDDRRITEPAQLRGRRVGVNRGYTVTTGVWARAILALEYDLDLDSVTWVRSGDEHVASYVPPSNVVNAPADSTLQEMLLDGEIDAVIGAAIDDPGVVTLIHDPVTAGLTALRDRGLYPINHLIVIADDVLARSPDVAPALCAAFAESKRRYLQMLHAGTLPTHAASDELHRQVCATTGWTDPLPYGLPENRELLELLVEQATAQHILREPVVLENLFAPGSAEFSG